MSIITVEVVSTGVEHIISRLEVALQYESLHRYLEERAFPHLQDEVVNRFAYEGDRKSGSWPDLAPSTVRIREQLGFPGDHPINERTGQMLQFLYSSSEYHPTSDGAEMNYPGVPTDGELEQKFRTAQQGNTVNPLIEGATTPARPVLAVDETDLADLLDMLSMWIVTEVGDVMI